MAALVLLTQPGWGAKPSAAPAANTVSPARDGYDGPPTLLGRGRKVKVGAYGGMGAAYTRFMDRDSALVSIEGALLLHPVDRTPNLSRPPTAVRTPTSWWSATG